MLLSNTAYRFTLPRLLTQFAFLYTPGPPAQGLHCPEWAGPSQISYQSRKCLSGLAYSSIWSGGGHFLNWSSLFSEDSNLGQVDTKLPSTPTKISPQSLPVMHFSKYFHKTKMENSRGCILALLSKPKIYLPNMKGHDHKKSGVSYLFLMYLRENWECRKVH